MCCLSNSEKNRVVRHTKSYPVVDLQKKLLVQKYFLMVTFRHRGLVEVDAMVYLVDTY